MVALLAREQFDPLQQLHPLRIGGPGGAHHDRGFKPLPPFAYVATDVPEDAQGDYQSKLEVGLAGIAGPRESCAQVVVVRLEQLEPSRRVCPLKLRLGPLRQGDEVLRVAAPELCRIREVVETLERVLANRLEHPEAAVPPTQQALLDERLQCVELRLADGLGRFERTAAGKHARGARTAVVPPRRAARSSRRSSPASVRCRSGASRAPPVRSGKRSLEPLEQRSRAVAL